MARVKRAVNVGVVIIITQEFIIIHALSIARKLTLARSALILTFMRKIYDTDIAIIGAGPSGLFMVFEAGYLGYNSVVIDSLPQVGGQLAELYPEKPIYDVPGHPEILAGDLVHKLKEQADSYKPTYLLDTAVEKLTENADGTFHLVTSTADVKAKAVVIAGGTGVFSPRKPKIEGLENFEDTSVFYSVKDKAALANKTIIIAGGGDSAVDWAIELAETANHVHVVHRRKDFRAAKDTVRQMKDIEKAGKITIHTPCQPKDLKGENGQISALTVVNLEGKTTDIAADVMLCFYGLLPKLGPIEDWGLNLEKKKVAVDMVTMETNRKGILAIGDIATYEGKIALILVGFAEAATAAKTVQSIIDPNKKFRVVYSTSQGVPGHEE